MTPEEIVEHIDTGNRAALRSLNITPNPWLMDLLNQAGMRSFKFGSDFCGSMIEGVIRLQLIGMDKSKEGK